MHKNKFTLKRKFVHETFCPKEMFDPKSFRVVKSGKHEVTIGCPKGKYKATVQSWNKVTKNLASSSRIQKRIPNEIQKTRKSW
jgi:hypothetical protein